MPVTRNPNLEKIFNGLIVKAVQKRHKISYSGLPLINDYAGIYVQTLLETFSLGINEDELLNISEEIRRCSKKSRFNCKIKVLTGDHMVIEDRVTNENCVVNVVQRLNSMDVIVHPMDGENVIANVLKSDLIYDVEKKIKLSREEHRLEYNGSILDYDSTYSHYQIPDGSVLNVIERLKDGILINVKSMDGKRITLQVLKTDKISDLKKKVEELFGERECVDRMVYAGVRLDDEGRTVEAYGVTENSVIDAIKLKNIMLLFVRSWNKTVSLTVTSGDTIGDFKRKIRFKLNIPENEQILIYNDDKLDDDDKTIGDYKISEKSLIKVLPLIRDRTQGFARTKDGKIIKFPLTDTVTVGDIKEKISKDLKISVEDQILMCKGSLLYDDQIANACGVNSGAIIDIFSRDIDIFTITIKDVEGSHFLQEVKCFERISDVKRKIETIVEITAYEQVFHFKGVILRDDSATVHSCNITADSVVEVSPISRTSIYILTLDNDPMSMEIFKSDTIGNVKKKIQEVMCIQPEEQIFIAREDVFSDDNRTLDHCHYPDENEYIVTVLLEEIKPEIQGICMVISNENFSNHKVRTGNKSDLENIKNTFGPLGYEVKIYHDVKKDSMDDIFNQTKMYVKDSHNMLIVIVLSHGEEKCMVTSDGQKIPFRDVWGSFTNFNFRKFIGKPKLFYFGCCRGVEVNKGVRGFKNPNIESDGYIRHSQKREIYPSMGDLFIGYATCKTYVACRHKLQGTFYIKTLCEVIQKHRRWSVDQIHQETQSLISEQRYQYIDGGKLIDYFQVPYYKNMLSKRAYFVDLDIETAE